MCLFVLLFILLCSSSCSNSHEGVDPFSDCNPSQPYLPELKMSIIIARHGDRTPLTLFQNTKSDWPEGKGQLTSLGMRQLFDHGQKFRERYIDELKFLKPSFKATEVYARATQKDRTMRSAQSFLIGLYPPGTGPLLSNAEGDYEPALPYGMEALPVHNIPSKLDSVLYAYKNCHRLQKMQKEFFRNPKYLRKMERHLDLLEELSEILGQEIELQDLRAVCDLSRAERRHDRPQTLNNTYWKEREKEIVEVSDFILSHKYTSHFMGQLGVGLLPKEIQLRFQDRSVNEGPHLLFLSVHDEALLALFAFLEAQYEILPSFSDYITFEMYDLGENANEEEGHMFRGIPGGRYFVEIQYKGLPLSTPACVGGIPGNNNFRQSESVGVCDLTFFLRFLDGATLANWPMECMRDDNPEVVSYTYSANVSKIMEFVEPLNLDLMEPGEEVAI